MREGRGEEVGRHRPFRACSRFPSTPRHDSTSRLASDCQSNVVSPYVSIARFSSGLSGLSLPLTAYSPTPSPNCRSRELISEAVARLSPSVPAAVNSRVCDNSAWPDLKPGNDESSCRKYSATPGGELLHGTSPKRWAGHRIAGLAPPRAPSSAPEFQSQWGGGAIYGSLCPVDAPTSRGGRKCVPDRGGNSRDAVHSSALDLISAVESGARWQSGPGFSGWRIDGCWIANLREPSGSPDALIDCRAAPRHRAVIVDLLDVRTTRPSDGCTSIR